MDEKAETAGNYLQDSVITAQVKAEILANHSLVSASCISRVNAAINDLRSLLQKG